jgi:hypothetical protein
MNDAGMAGNGKKRDRGRRERDIQKERGREGESENTARL